MSGRNAIGDVTSRPDEPSSARWLLRRAPPSDPPRQRGGRRWVFAASLAISALLHLIALLVLRFESELVSGFVPGDPVVRGPPVGMVVYDIEPVEEADGPTPDEVQRPARRIQEPEPGPPVQIPPVRPEPAPSVTELPPPSARVPSAASSVAKRVNPIMGDPHLWDRSEPIGKAPGNTEDAVPRRITIEEWNAVVNPRPSFKEFNDSIRLAEERAAKAVDWTVKTGNGGRWGVTPKGIHLGSMPRARRA